MKVYLAGKITKNGWRQQFVPGLRSAYQTGGEEYGDDWPIIKDGLGPGLDYVGPFFTGCDHGCTHGKSNHATSGGCVELRDKHYAFDESREDVAARCMQRVGLADAIIALISDDAHGTLVEVGYAAALRKSLYVTQSKDGDWFEYGSAWFPFHIPGAQVMPSVKYAVKYLQDQANRAVEAGRCESPIEKQYLAAIRKRRDLDSFVPAVPVMGGKYRIDFADQSMMLGIEIDGFEYHSSKEDLIKDRSRQRALETAGWLILRFAGSEVYRDADLCARQTEAWVRAVGNKAS